MMKDAEDTSSSDTLLKRSNEKVRKDIDVPTGGVSGDGRGTTLKK